MNIYSPEFMDFLKVYNSESCVILDTETTGLERGEIVEIALTDTAGQLLYSSYVKPKNIIPADATVIHGIGHATVEFAPSWEVVREQVIERIRGKAVIIYNAVYDRKMMHQSDEACGLPRTEYKELATFHCAMLAYAEFFGEWNSYRQSYRWQSLSNAAGQQLIGVKDAHSALGDCIMTAHLIAVMNTKAQVNPRNPNNIDLEQSQHPF